MLLRRFVYCRDAVCHSSRGARHVGPRMRGGSDSGRPAPAHATPPSTNEGPPHIEATPHPDVAENDATASVRAPG